MTCRRELSILLYNINVRYVSRLQFPSPHLLCIVEPGTDRAVSIGGRKWLCYSDSLGVPFTLIAMISKLEVSLHPLLLVYISQVLQELKSAVFLSYKVTLH